MENLINKENAKKLQETTDKTIFLLDLLDLSIHDENAIQQADELEDRLQELAK